MRLLLVEDDRRLAAGIVEGLRAAGYVVDHAADGIEGQYLGEVQDYALVILDLGLPGRGGLDVLRAWRGAERRMPVLILTARDTWQERVEGLRAGADDYLGKPFHQEELRARVQALIRRDRQAPAEIRVGDLCLDEERQRVRDADGVAHPLTGTEFRLLRALMLGAGRVQSKQQLAEQVYEGDADRDANVIEVYIRRLRRLVGADRIETRRGQGYVLHG